MLKFAEEETDLILRRAEFFSSHTLPGCPYKLFEVRQCGNTIDYVGGDTISTYCKLEKFPLKLFTIRLSNRHRADRRKAGKSRGYGSTALFKRVCVLSLYYRQFFLRGPEIFILLTGNRDVGASVRDGLTITQMNS